MSGHEFMGHQNEFSGTLQSPEKPTQFLSLQDVLKRTTISRSLLYQLIKDPVTPFPSPVHIGRRSVWIEHEIEEYIATIIANERD